MSNKSKSLVVSGVNVSWFSTESADYISLTDMVKNYDGDKSVIGNWISNKSTIEFLGIWEKLNNPDFKLLEFQEFYNNAGVGRFVLSPQRWVDMTNAIGLVSKSGRLGGTYAHKDIAFEFAAWLSPEFKLYLIKEFQRLKEDEQKKLESGWNMKRMLAKVNYKTHTDAVKNRLIPPLISKQQAGGIYANEADLINLAVFGMTAKAWRDSNPEKPGNMRDHATIEQLLVLSNLEFYSSQLIDQNIPRDDRLVLMSKSARDQMTSLLNNPSIKKLKSE